MGETIRFVLSCICTVGGLFVLLSGIVGIFRFTYALNRIHAAALFDTVGILLMLLGVMIAEGLDIATLKMILTVVLLWLSSPVASHLIGRLEITVNEKLDQEMKVMDEGYVRHEKEGR